MISKTEMELDGERILELVLVEKNSENHFVQAKLSVINFVFEPEYICLTEVMPAKEEVTQGVTLNPVEDKIAHF